MWILFQVYEKLCCVEYNLCWVRVKRRETITVKLLRALIYCPLVSIKNFGVLEQRLLVLTYCILFYFRNIQGFCNLCFFHKVNKMS
jgi:hypothetical protein